MKALCYFNVFPFKRFSSRTETLSISILSFGLPFFPLYSSHIDQAPRLHNYRLRARLADVWSRFNISVNPRCESGSFRENFASWSLVIFGQKNKKNEDIRGCRRNCRRRSSRDCNRIHLTTKVVNGTNEDPWAFITLINVQVLRTFTRSG